MIRVCIRGKERGVVRDGDRFNVAATQRDSRDGQLFVGNGAKRRYGENREYDSMNFVRFDNEDGCLRGQESDGFDGGVLDQQISNQRGKKNEWKSEVPRLGD